jgi:hypothetical protein
MVTPVRGIGIVGALAAVLALAACGGGGGGGGKKLLTPEQSKQAVVTAADKTRASTVHLELAVSLKQVNGQGAAVYNASGDLGPELGHIQLDQRNVGGDLKQVVIDHRAGHLIVYSTPVSIPLPKGKTWLELDLTRYGMRRYGANTIFLSGADQDPFAALDLATAPSAHVTDLGLEYLPDATVNTHYRAKVDLVAVARDKGIKGKGLQALEADMTGGAEQQTIDIWVAKSGQIARVQVAKTLRNANGGALRQTSIADFSRFGEQVHVTLPPAAKTADYLTLGK